jgi:hypothetical protein
VVAKNDNLIFVTICEFTLNIMVILACPEQPQQLPESVVSGTGFAGTTSAAEAVRVFVPFFCLPIDHGIMADIRTV